MSNFYFIGGASGSGKTAIKNDLQKILDTMIVYDFDDIGVPENADKKWRQQTTEKWLEKLISDDQDACLLGQIVLGELLTCPSANQVKNIHFCLLDVNDLMRVQRLKQRHTGELNQHTLNWASWLRMHHQDPQWMQQVIKEDSWQALDFSRWDQFIDWHQQASINIINTTTLTLEQVVKSVSDWIKKEV